MRNRFWDVLNRPMVVISTRGVNTMYEECVCEIFFQIKIFFASKTFFEFAGTSQKWVKNRLPRSPKKSKIIDFAVFQPHKVVLLTVSWRIPLKEVPAFPPQVASTRC